MPNMLLSMSHDTKRLLGADKLFAAAMRSVLRPSHTADGSIIVIDGGRRERDAGHFIREKTRYESQTKTATGGFLRWENRLASLGPAGRPDKNRGGSLA